MKSTILVATLTLILRIPSSVMAADPIGYLDVVNDSGVAGWTCDPDNFLQAVEVHIYATRVQTGAPVGEPGSGFCVDIEGERACLLAVTMASEAREPAVEQLCGGHANHGFNITTPFELKNGGKHKVYAFAINIDGGENPRLSNGVQYQFTFDGTESGWDYGLQRRCVKSPGPEPTNFFQSIADCPTPPSPDKRWTIFLESERAGYESCSGPINQSLPISASWGTGNFQFAWSSIGGEVTAHFKTDITSYAGPAHAEHPCGVGLYNWFVLMDHLGVQGGPFPRADRMGVKFEAKYSDWILHPASASRYFVGCGAMWGGRGHTFEIDLIESNWGGDAYEDPELIQVWPNLPGNHEYAVLSGRALGFEVERDQMHSIQVNCGAIFRHLVNRGIFDPVPNWADASGAAAMIGHEFYNGDYKNAGAAYVEVKSIGVEDVAF